MCGNHHCHEALQTTLCSAAAAAGAKANKVLTGFKVFKHQAWVLLHPCPQTHVDASGDVAVTGMQQGVTASAIGSVC
jgi:hypothetical protein